jgi:hypothetical protein
MWEGITWMNVGDLTKDECREMNGMNGGTKLWQAQDPTTRSGRKPSRTVRRSGRIPAP